MTHPFYWLYWLGAFGVVVLLLSIAALVQDIIQSPPPDSKFPPGYGYPSREDWQWKTMEKFRASLFKRLVRWWRLR